MVVSLRDELAATRAELQRAVTRIAELEARLASNSGNSSKPPSSDGLAKPAPKTRSLRAKTDREPGGQPGHDGATLRQVDRPDQEVRHEPGSCDGCGRSLAGRPVTAIERRQCFDLPPVKIEVSEHQLIERECTCGHRTRASAPAGIDAPVQYGPRIAAVVVYLYIGQFLSKKRTAQALAELFGTPLSAGTVAALTARAAGGLDEFLTVVGGRLADAEVVGFDETGLRRRAGCIGCTAPAPTSTPWSPATPSAAGPASTTSVSLIVCVASLSTTPGRRTTPTPTSNINFAAPMHFGSYRPSPTPLPWASGAGPPKPATRSSRCRNSLTRRAKQATPASTAPLWPSRSTATGPRR